MQLLIYPKISSKHSGFEPKSISIHCLSLIVCESPIDDALFD